MLDLVRQACARVLEIDPASVRASSLFDDDLHADSLAVVEVVEVLEEELDRVVPGFRLEDEDLDRLRTVGDAVDRVLARL